MRRELFAVALAGLIAFGLWTHGYHAGGLANEAKHVEATIRLQRELFDAADRLSEKSAEVEALRAAQATRAIAAEDAARADPDAAVRRPSADSLRRLQQRWGADSGG